MNRSLCGEDSETDTRQFELDLRAKRQERRANERVRREAEGGQTIQARRLFELCDRMAFRDRWLLPLGNSEPDEGLLKEMTRQDLVSGTDRTSEAIILVSYGAQRLLGLTKQADSRFSLPIDFGRAAL